MLEESEEELRNAKVQLKDIVLNLIMPFQNIPQTQTYQKLDGHTG